MGEVELQMGVSVVEHILFRVVLFSGMKEKRPVGFLGLETTPNGYEHLKHLCFWWTSDTHAHLCPPTI